MTTVSGSGSVKSAKPHIAAAAKEKVKGTGSVKSAKPHISGVSKEKEAGTATLRIPKPRIIGAGAQHIRRLTWDDAGGLYTQGVSNGVLYPKKSPGVAWNGLLSFTEKGDDSSSALYVDGRRYRTRIVPNAFAGTISAYTYPDEFEPYNGISSGATGQSRIPFGFSWQTNREIHIVYNVLAAPSKDQYQSLSADVNPVSFSWDVTTLPENIPGGRPSSHLTIMLDYAHPEAVSALEDIIYGDDANGASLPDVQTIFDLFDTYATLRIVDNGDGTWTATGPDDIISISGDEFTIDWASAVFIDDVSYHISSL